MNMNDKTITLYNAYKDYQNIYLASRNFTEPTRREYLCDITQLLEFLSLKGVTEAHRATLNHLNEYLAHLDTRNLAGATRRRKTSSIKSFFAYLEEAEYTQSDISKRLIPPKKEDQEPRVLSDAEYHRLLRAVANVPRDA